VKPAPQQQRSLRIELLWLLPALVLGFLIYTNALHGDFVYDDQRQIVRNTLIQDGSQFWRAMISDVWAFKGGDRAVSNYWRPSFVVWMILNFRCFGLDTFGWHLANILLHLAVVALAFVLLRRLNVSRPVAGAIALIFAVHPAHSESVAWISGAPDLILCVAMLGSIWFVILLGEEKTPLRWALSLALYVVALGAKEVAVLYPLIVVALLWHRERDDPGGKSVSWARTGSIAWPFAVVVVAYVIARQLILGTIERLPEGGASLSGTILTAPAVFAFYLRQMIVPFWIGPSYPLRAVTTVNIGVGNFIFPLAIAIVGGCWMIKMAGQSKTARIGLALFLIPLLPAMNIAAFHPEQLAHDRYLYVPLLGFLILTVPALASSLQRVAGERMSRQALLVFIFAVIVALPLAAQTVRYNRAWTSNLALWTWGVRSDPTSAFNYQQYGVALHDAKKLEEAIGAFNRSIEIHATPTAYVARGTTLIDQKKFAEAERDLHAVTSKQVSEVTPYPMYQAYERLAVSFTQQRKLEEAAGSIAEARGRLPQYTAALTEKLAVILYQNGQKDKALDELNAVRAQGRTETLPESRLIFYRLGLLNAELGHREDARNAFQEFLSLTRDMLTPEIKRARSESEVGLRNLSQPVGENRARIFENFEFILPQAPGAKA
jgi:tetratricopeptide (TPR) repeat protein